MGLLNRNIKLAGLTSYRGLLAKGKSGTFHWRWGVWMLALAMLVAACSSESG